MAKTAGRLCVIKKAATTIGGIRTAGMTVNGSPINVEDQGDNGFATYLSGILTGQSLEITGEGYEEDQVLRDIALGVASGRFMSDITFEFPNGDEISGNFVLSGYSETGAFEDGQTFTATFTSDGSWTYTEAV
jgi:predicted secreted protein